MDPAMLVFDTDDSTTMINIEWSMALSPSPFIDVAVHHPQCGRDADRHPLRPLFGRGGRGNGANGMIERLFIWF